MGRIVIAGGTGFLGIRLIAALDAAGHDLVILSTKHGKHPKAKLVLWDGQSAGIGTWANELDGADAVFNLCGRPVNVPWTEENKKKILSSRVNSTRAIGEAISKSPVPPKVWINASATGFYGDRKEQPLDESKSRGPGFLADVCVAWEDAVREHKVSARCVELRTGVVLGPGGGAFPQLLKAAKGFTGGPVGDGRQWVPWIHLYDWVRMAEWLITEPVKGPVNAVAPTSARNSELMAALRKANHTPWGPRIPRWALNLGAKFGGPEPSLLLASTRAIPMVAQDKGFEFLFSNIDAAIAELCK